MPHGSLLTYIYLPFNSNSEELKKLLQCYNYNNITFVFFLFLIDVFTFFKIFINEIFQILIKF